jgi:hypothetical protein
MIEQNGYDAYVLWTALKLHFTSDYDFFKYKGKSNLSKDSFSRNKLKFYFYRLARKYTQQELQDLIIANALQDHALFAGYLETSEAESNLLKMQKRIQALQYNFEKDLDYLLDNHNLDDLVRVKNGDWPELMRMTLENKIIIETLIILNDITNFFPYWQQKISDDIIWPKFKMKCEKYSPFIGYNKDAYKKILKEKLKNHE